MRDRLVRFRRHWQQKRNNFGDLEIKDVGSNTDKAQLKGGLEHVSQPATSRPIEIASARDLYIPRLPVERAAGGPTPEKLSTLTAYYTAARKYCELDANLTALATDKDIICRDVDTLQQLRNTAHGGKPEFARLFDLIEPESLRASSKRKILGQQKGDVRFEPLVELLFVKQRIPNVAAALAAVNVELQRLRFLPGKYPGTFAQKELRSWIDSYRAAQKSLKSIQTKLDHGERIDTDATDRAVRRDLPTEIKKLSGKIKTLQAKYRHTSGD